MFIDEVFLDFQDENRFAIIKIFIQLKIPNTIHINLSKNYSSY